MFVRVGMCEDAFKYVFVYSFSLCGSQEATWFVKPNTSNSSSSHSPIIHRIGTQREREREIKGCSTDVMAYASSFVNLHSPLAIARKYGGFMFIENRNLHVKRVCQRQRDMWQLESALGKEHFAIAEEKLLQVLLSETDIDLMQVRGKLDV